ncbi:olfactory receptor 7C1-like [Boleophthalmus pectinirostris]|uniref:olfactory receptor 7C1-like n=1 Tax=Boleophthalmus pectinirostris TaxID=150288 RepID=UPI00242C4572|nr:olfactory receptor 7C1-like [Boleophthalmus pectinirostris]
MLRVSMAPPAGNSSHVSVFSLLWYVDLGVWRLVVFSVVLLSYLLIIGANVLVLVVIFSQRSLHEPMYVFLSSLLLNELNGSAGLFPFFLVQLLRDVHTVNATLCSLQIFCLYLYVNVQFYSFAVMSYDRYLAICWPLHYGAVMRPRVVALLVVLSWCLPVAAIVTMTTLSATLTYCRRAVERLYCDNYSVVKLSCDNTVVNNVYGLLYTFIVLFGLTLVILTCYARILRVCFTSTKRRHKALSTCTPHLASLLNFSLGCFLEIIQSRLDMTAAPLWLRVTLSMYFITFQPLFNPLLFGLNLTKIRQACRRLLGAGLRGAGPERAGLRGAGPRRS